jgi:hypothetical protein
MPMTHIDMIMGINSILYSLYDFFLDMLRNAKNYIKKHKIPTPSPILRDIHPPICTSYDIPNHPDYHDCVPTWPETIDDVAVEDSLIPDCVNFGVNSF